MEEPCQPESLSSCHNVSDIAYYVRNKAELCIQNYMSRDVTAKYLEKTHRISKSVTRIASRRESSFFQPLRLEMPMARQMRMFNDMFTKQGVGMFENGLLDISDASPSVRTLLRQQHPERVHLLETLGIKKKQHLKLSLIIVSNFENSLHCIASKTKLSSASFALPCANGPSVAQTQILYNQQDQVFNSASFGLPNPNGPLVVQSPNPYNQQDQVLSPASFAMPNPSFLYSAILASPDENGPSGT
ncbi:hypothetical protein Bca52824_027925 [Brassica carinata]|uniref:Uncharacterized protein n=1 Tax=Brassica carinata TaxID=52824 RepID=A0A8X7VBC1_BRACI|nr:hypothetical protein Bca52824_027925 [Brassica carinata]